MPVPVLVQHTTIQPLSLTPLLHISYTAHTSPSVCLYKFACVWCSSSFTFAFTQLIKWQLTSSGALVFNWINFSPISPYVRTFYSMHNLSSLDCCVFMWFINSNNSNSKTTPVVIFNQGLNLVRHRHSKLDSKNLTQFKAKLRACVSACTTADGISRNA